MSPPLAVKVWNVIHGGEGTPRFTERVWSCQPMHGVEKADGERMDEGEGATGRSGGELVLAGGGGSNGGMEEQQRSSFCSFVPRRGNSPGASSPSTCTLFPSRRDGQYRQFTAPFSPRSAVSALSTAITSS
jgi:hypothetical protein